MPQNIVKRSGSRTSTCFLAPNTKGVSVQSVSSSHKSGTESGTKFPQIVVFPNGDVNKTTRVRCTRKSKKNRTSSYLGVSFDKQTGKWRAKSKMDPILRRYHTKRFDQEEEAFKWVSQKNLELRERNRLTRDLDHAERLEAIEAIIKLENIGLYSRGVILRAVDELIRRNPEAFPTTLQDLFSDWLDHKRGIKKCSNPTVITAKGVIQEFVEKYADTPVNAITREMCKGFVYDRHSGKSSFHRFRYLRELFNFAQKEGKLSPDPDAHPLWNLDKPKERKLDEDDEYKTPWSLEDFETLLRFSIENEDKFQCTAYILLGAYAGIRTSEMLKLEFAEIKNRRTHGIDIDRGIVSIPASIAKTKAKRNFQMHPDLRSALQILRDRPRAPRKKYCGNLKRPTDLGSKVATNTEARLKGFRRILHLPRAEGGAELPFFSPGGQIKKDKTGNSHVTGKSAWIKNGLRTSFASYHYDAHNDKKLTASIMGHTDSLHVFDEHYRMLVQNGEGEQFFKIVKRVFAEFGYYFD